MRAIKELLGSPKITNINDYNSFAIKKKNIWGSAIYSLIIYKYLQNIIYQEIK